MNTQINNCHNKSYNEYHGIIINRSQRDKAIFKTIEIIGERKSLWGLLALYKIRVLPENIDGIIKAFQSNMADKLFFKKQEFYFHFYRNNELIVVFRDKIFRVSPDKSTWGEVIAHGHQLKIADTQLDFTPNTFDSEIY
jgi:hypothetical protein